MPAFASGLPALPSPLRCPYCQSSAMRCATVGVDNVRRETTYLFDCACGAEIQASVPAGVDPTPEIEAVRAGKPARASVSASMTVSTLGYFGYGGRIGPYAPSVQPLAAEPPAEPREPGPELRRCDGSFVGYRAWKLCADWQLAGTGGVSPKPWTPGINEAECAYGKHAAPDEGCGCGLYALARFDEGKQWWTDTSILGAVEAWADEDDTNRDRFFLHRTGFRAQYAKIVLLAVSGDYPRAKNAAIRALAAEHGADVCKREHLEDAAREHGQLVPDELLEWAGEGDRPAGEGLGALTAQMQAMARAWQQSAISVDGAVQWLAQSSLQSGQVDTGADLTPQPKGVKQTLRTPGPPGHGKHRTGDRVKDSRRDVWECVRGGKPGTWTKEP